MGDWLLTFLRRKLPPSLAAGFLRRHRYKALVYLPREEQEKITQFIARGHLVAEMKAGRATWVHLACPCHCGARLCVNLMGSVEPAWSLFVDRKGRATLAPSLDVPACGSHFFLRVGRVRWVRLRDTPRLTNAL